MSSITVRLGELDPSQHLAGEISLEVLEDLPGVSVCRKAVDWAATERRGALVVGPKGAGKSVGLDMAQTWFRALEDRLYESDENYRKRRVLRVGDLRGLNYRDTGVVLTSRLSRRYTDRVRGRKKNGAEILADLVQLLGKMGYALLIVDEAEFCSDDTFRFLRNLISDADAASPTRYRDGNGRLSAGIGVLIAGDPSIEPRLQVSDEAGHRFVTQFDIPPVTLDHALRAYERWLPGLGAHVEQIGSEAWQNYMESLLWQGDPPSFRTLENHARMYAWYMIRIDSTITEQSRIGFHQEVFEHALKQVSWARSTRPGRGKT